MGATTTSRREQARQMRAKIQNAALDLFDKEGFENVSVEQIAQAVGCSVGNIYHYFKSKDELALQVTASVDRIYLELEKQYAQDVGSTAYEKLMDFVGRTLRASVEDALLYKCFIQGLKHPEQGILQDKGQRVYHRMLRQLAAACQAEGSITSACSAAEIAELLVTLHRGVLFQWRIDEGGYDLIARGQKMAAALLKGLE